MTTANRSGSDICRGWWPFAMALLLMQFAPVNSALAVAPAPNASTGLQQCLDVELTPEGWLQGHCTGIGTCDSLAKTPPEQLLLRDANGSVVEISYDAAGRFVVEGLHGGTYQLTLGTESWLVRIWATGTAPPVATRLLHLRTNREIEQVAAENLIVRGQWAPPPKVNKLARAIKYGGNHPLVVSGVLAAAVGIPVAVHNLNQDDNS